MKKLVLVLVLGTQLTHANVECYYRFTDSIIDITPEMRVNGCTADFVWGFDNVCFTGSARALAKKINSDYYSWGRSLSVKEAKVINSKTVEFIGVDAQSFYQGKKDIQKCD